MSLFGSTNAFGASNINSGQQQQQQTNSLFGSVSQPQQQQGQSGSLFGSTAQPQQQTSSLFGAQQAQPTQSTNVFGGQQTQQPAQSLSLWGNAAPQQPAASQWGNNTQPTQSTGGFGAPLQSQQNNNGLFGQQQPSASAFGATQAQQSQQPGRSLWQPNSSLQPREKTVPEQMHTLLEKWSPESSTCLFQHYFYNHVAPETVPYYGPGPGEDETKWEEALSKKPSDDAIPVICKGFSALGNRLRIQVQSVVALQTRLHEINNSLTAMLQTHDVDISVRTNDARRRHTSLSQRSLRLATKIQVLRNRGYALDGAEEGLRKRLQELERNTFDQKLGGRQEEIWARMVQLRERTRALQEQADKIGTGAVDSREVFLDQDVLKQTKKILDDYDKQISHLSREMELIRKEFADWENPGASDLSGR